MEWMKCRGVTGGRIEMAEGDAKMGIWGVMGLRPAMRSEEFAEMNQGGG
jgi:hypothetical protein